MICQRAAPVAQGLHHLLARAAHQAQKVKVRVAKAVAQAVGVKAIAQNRPALALLHLQNSLGHPAAQAVVQAKGANQVLHPQSQDLADPIQVRAVVRQLPAAPSGHLLHQASALP